jgi:hypothetical protein
MIYICVSLLLLFLSQSSPIPPAQLPQFRVGVLVIVWVFGSMCTCIYCVLYCLYCDFVLFLSCTFIIIICFSVLVEKVSSNNNNNNNNNTQKLKFGTVINISYVCVKNLSSFRLRW